MLIVDKIKPDPYGRISLQKVKGHSDKIGFVIDVGAEMIEIISPNDENEKYFVDWKKTNQNHRFTIPVWIMSEIGSSELFLVYEEGKYYLSKKTGSII